MAYDDIDDDEYNAQKDTGSTEYWQKKWKEEKEEKQEEEKKLSEEVVLYYKCPKCGYVSKTKDKVQLRYVDEIVAKLGTSVCPECGHTGLKLVDKKEYEKLYEKYKLIQKEKLKKKDVDIDKKRNVINKNIKEDTKDLMDDLRQRILSDKLSPKFFVSIFCKLSVDIAKRYSKDLPGSVDYISFTKQILNLSDTVLDYYDVKEDSEKVLQECDEDIEQNELYLAEYKYYIEDDKYALPDYELANKVKEYEMMQGKLQDKISAKSIEEKYQERRKILEEKADERLKNRCLRELSI